MSEDKGLKGKYKSTENEMMIGESRLKIEFQDQDIPTDIAE
jgi:hypothetical protein